MRLRPATRADLPRIHEVRHGTAENRLRHPERVTDAEVLWYLEQAVFLVSEDETHLQGFTCANHQTGTSGPCSSSTKLRDGVMGRRFSTLRPRG